MRLMTLELIKKRMLDKRSKKDIKSKQLEYQLVIELKEKLDIYLEENDFVMIEVSPKVLGEFINILTDNLLIMYDYEQVDKTKFIFSNKEITF